MGNAERITADRQLIARLESDRSSWESHWRDLGDYFNPRGYRFSTSDVNRGGKKNGKILNSVPPRAARTMAAGLYSWITTPARPWFDVRVADSDLMALQSVKEYLEEVSRRLRATLGASNFYKVVPAVFRDLAVYGTAAMQMDEDDADVLRCYHFPIGSYALASSERQVVDTCARQFSMTVRQLANRFGADRLPDHLRARLETAPEDWIEGVRHLCGPNPNHVPGSPFKQHKRFRSVYLLPSGNGDTYLSESGYDEFPVMAPRWQTTGEDTYGESPAMLALPPAKALMVYEKRIGQALEKQMNPALKGPSDLTHNNEAPLPGEFIKTNNADKIGSVYAADTFRVDYADAKAQRIEAEINECMFVSLFLMLMNSDRRQITAEEIRARQEEKILALGDPLGRLNDELLGPAIERAFAICSRRGLMPEPPEELRGQRIEVEYVSVLHKVQKMARLGEIDRLTQFVGGIAGAFPEVLDKIDADQAVDEYAESLGVPPSIVRSDEDVEARRQARRQANEQAQAQQQAAMVVQGAKVMSETDTGGRNALTDLMRTSTGISP